MRVMVTLLGSLGAVAMICGVFGGGVDANSVGLNARWCNKSTQAAETCGIGTKVRAKIHEKVAGNCIIENSILLFSLILTGLASAGNFVKNIHGRVYALWVVILVMSQVMHTKGSRYLKWYSFGMFFLVLWLRRLTISFDVRHVRLAGICVFVWSQLMIGVNGQFVTPDEYYFSFDTFSRINKTTARDYVNGSIINFFGDAVISEASDYVTFGGTGYGIVQGSETNDIFRSNAYTLFANVSFTNRFSTNDGYTWRTIISKNTPTRNPYELGLFVDTAVGEVHIYYTTYCTPKVGPISENTWYSVGFVVNGTSSATFYWNAVAYSCFIDDTRPPKTQAPIVLGRWYAGEPLRHLGKIASVSIFRAALSATQINAMHTNSAEWKAQLSRTFPQPVPTASPTRKPSTKSPTAVTKKPISPTSCKPCVCPSVPTTPCGSRNQLSCTQASTCAWNNATQTCGCSGIAADYVFVVDRSGSINKTTVVLEEHIVHNIISTMVPQKSNVGIITFSTDANPFIKLRSSLTRTQILSKIFQMPYSGGETFTEKALAMALTSPDYLGNGALNKYQRIILITDGSPTRKVATCNWANTIIAKTGLKVVVVGVSSDFKKTDVGCLVAHQPSSAEWILKMPNFLLGELENIRPKLEPKICVTSASKSSKSVQVLMNGATQEKRDVEKYQSGPNKWIVGVIVGVVGVVYVACVVAGVLLWDARRKYETIDGKPTETTRLKA